MYLVSILKTINTVMPYWLFKYLFELHMGGGGGGLSLFLSAWLQVIILLAMCNTKFSLFRYWNLHFALQEVEFSQLVLIKLWSVFGWCAVYCRGVFKHFTVQKTKIRPLFGIHIRIYWANLIYPNVFYYQCLLHRYYSLFISVW
jgi:hypothetical protein